jgi:hypothetical protein
MSLKSFEVVQSFTLGKIPSSDEMEKYMYLIKKYNVRGSNVLHIVSL